MEKLLDYTMKHKEFTRKEFKNLCPRTNKDGGCEFAVAVRILEFMEIGWYDIKNSIFKINK